ncbi:MAG TPA: YggS family pyridoxal phosphate-dependent enzyme [Bryobacteraceae bacterium]|nr:YggS family pyridoxal phosphate-dependent enzyme [Bryobacteraceae bacterium]
MFRDRLAAVEERIHNACARSGRNRSSVTLIAVSKLFGPPQMREAYECGLRDFGENYVQEFAGKAPDLADCTEARFHLIGHLQSNKTRVASDIFQVIQTVDTPKLARRLNDSGQKLQVMVEVKLSDEDSKSGADPGDVPALVQGIRGCPNLHLLGLMTIPPWTDQAEASRPYFQRLLALARDHQVEALSMGMSHDFEVAIEEGATHIRVGTALFGQRRKT